MHISVWKARGDGNGDGMEMVVDGWGWGVDGNQMYRDGMGMKKILGDEKGILSVSLLNCYTHLQTALNGSANENTANTGGRCR